jgi:hypothetical protein
MSIEAHKKLLDSIDGEMERIYASFVKVMRDTVVVPFLKRKKLHLGTGMGTCSIDTPDDKINFLQGSDGIDVWIKNKNCKTQEEWDAANERAKAIQALQGWDEVWAILNLHSDHMKTTVGQDMESYKGE